MPDDKIGRIVAGSSVFHKPTGEEWYILGVNYEKGKLCVGGWPASIADISDCELLNEGKGITESEKEYRSRTFGSGWE